MPVILIAARQASPEEILVGMIFVGILLIAIMVTAAGERTRVIIQGGLPYCPRCGRQVRLRRGYCRACGYQFTTYFREPDPVDPEMVPAKRLAPTRRVNAVKFNPIEGWERLHLDNLDQQTRFLFTLAIEKMLHENILEPKKLQRAADDSVVILRRSRLQYEAHIELYVAQDRHGFTVSVPMHDFKIRISIPRYVPNGMMSTPWEDLYDNLCKIDRTVIKARNSRSQPLTYKKKYGPHPLLRVEVLQRKTQEGGPVGLPKPRTT